MEEEFNGLLDSALVSKRLPARFFFIDESQSVRDQRLYGEWCRCSQPLQYISVILRPVVVSYHRSLPNVFYQQDNARPGVACSALTFLDAHDILLLP
ncbi:hypothetical protein TNCV_2682701 [Trichonephila clavipes]|nr:hypothetical protein TNCV_2682701 [Trichonephila clavipes]